jgi:hypothetical protein
MLLRGYVAMLNSAGVFAPVGGLFSISSVYNWVWGSVPRR